MGVIGWGMGIIGWGIIGGILITLLIFFVMMIGLWFFYFIISEDLPKRKKNKITTLRLCTPFLIKSFIALFIYQLLLINVGNFVLSFFGNSIIKSTFLSIIWLYSIVFMTPFSIFSIIILIFSSLQYTYITASLDEIFSDFKLYY